MKTQESIKWANVIEDDNIDILIKHGWIVLCLDEMEEHADLHVC